MLLFFAAGIRGVPNGVCIHGAQHTLNLLLHCNCTIVITKKIYEQQNFC